MAPSGYGILSKSDLTALTARVVALENRPVTSSDEITSGDDVAAAESSSAVTATKSFDFRTATLSGTTITFSTGDVASLNGSNTSSASLSSTDGLTNNTQNWVTLPIWSIGPDFSLELYFKSSSGTDNSVVHFYDGANRGGFNTSNNIAVQRAQSTNKLMFWTRAGSDDQNAQFAKSSDDVAAFADTFTHVIVTHDSTTETKQLYVNGSAVTLQSHADSITSTTKWQTENGDVTSGARDNMVVGASAFNDSGIESIRYLKAYGSVLSSSDVSTLYAAL